MGQAGSLRPFVASALGLAAGIFAFTAAFGLTSSRLSAGLIAALAAGIAWGLARRPAILPLDEAACPRRLRILSGLATAVALVLLARLAVFMIDPAQTAYSTIPGSRWEVEHSCLSAYYVAGAAASSASNIYDNSLYSTPDDDPSLPRKARMLGPFKIDVFEYPPPFLLLPRALMLLTPDFTRLRMLWFGLNCFIVLLSTLLVARLLRPAAGTRALLLSPFIWMAIPTVGVFQKGNVQAIVIAGSMLAMILFERGRPAAGGALLAFATVSKLYPGLLGVYLLARRQWRALAWTAVMGVAFIVLSLFDLGRAPYAAFLDHLPGLVGGEAFPAFRFPPAMAINFSVPGLVFKLKLFGVPGMSFGASKIVGWAYTLVVLAAVVSVARRPLREDVGPLVWMAILILATLRSPFLPQAYASFPALWLLTLLAARHSPTPRLLGMVVLGWAALSIYWPVDWALDPRILAIANLVPQAATAGVAVLALRDAREPATVPAS